MFGDQIEITRGGQKVGLKHIDDYGSDVDTDDLANDSDLDTSTRKSTLPVVYRSRVLVFARSCMRVRVRVCSRSSSI